MFEYELEPTQRLQYLIERRDTVARINEESLDLFIEWRTRTYSLFSNRDSDYANVATQVTAMELTLARLDREIAELKAVIAHGSEPQDPMPKPLLPDDVPE